MWSLSRSLLASMFVYGGIDAVRNPKAKAAKAETVTDPLTEAVSIQADPVDLVRLNGAVQVSAGLVLAGGRFPRLSAAVLAASLIVTTAAGHRFWEERDEARSRPTDHSLPQELVDARRVACGRREIVNGKRN